MTVEEAIELIGKGPLVITRGRATWEGEVVSVADQPTLTLEREDGTRFSLALDGARVL